MCMGKFGMLHEVVLWFHSLNQLRCWQPSTNLWRYRGGGSSRPPQLQTQPVTPAPTRLHWAQTSRTGEHTRSCYDCSKIHRLFIFTWVFKCNSSSTESSESRAQENNENPVIKNEEEKKVKQESRLFPTWSAVAFTQIFLCIFSGRALSEGDSWRRDRSVTRQKTGPPS